MKRLTTAKSAVFEILKTQLPKDYVFHNYAFVLNTIEAVEEIASGERLKDKERLLQVNLAACFYLSGYATDKVFGGATSRHLATSFLESENYTESEIAAVIRLIEVTNVAVVPVTKEEKVMQDAVYFFLADKNFNDYQELWRSEHEAVQGEALSDDDWYAFMNAYIDEKLFYTGYAAKNWQFKIRNNVMKVIARERRQSAKQVEKGRDTVFRITLRNHISLSDNADRKAHILLSVNAIVISIIFSRIFPKLDNPSNAFLYVPTLVFVIFTVISIILSVIATRPRVTKGQFSHTDISHKKTNILFFGNFHRVKLEEYEKAMDVLLSSNEYIYNSLTKDLYYLGKVVAKKYRILQYTYGVFMVGIIISTILYIVYFNMYN